MNAFGGARVEARPPEKGAFPLDHRGECRQQMKVTDIAFQASHRGRRMNLRQPFDSYFVGLSYLRQG